MANPNAGAAVVAAWSACMEDEVRRLKDRVTELHRWERSRNGRWVDRGWMRCPSRSEDWLLDALNRQCNGYK